MSSDVGGALASEEGVTAWALEASVEGEVATSSVVADGVARPKTG